ncbi:MAG: FAD-dependent oxidoreductase [Chloroflexi bacterium]|nr:FAD-dependent oxidoreductase [Chloroflexota bacterium]
MVIRFPLLFSPIRVGNLTLKNRIVNTAHGTGFTKDHLFTDQHLHYYLSRAKGGVAMIITENASVHPTSNVGSQDTLWGFDPRIVASYRKLSEAVHRCDCHILVQLSHQGRQSGSVEGTPRWAPSPIPSPESSYGPPEVPHEMDPEEIAELVEAFAGSAALAREGGMDGVELHGGHGNLIHQFFSPLSNQRSDRYGGSVENRARFALEIIDAVRRAVGDDMVVGMRISADEFRPGGLDLAQMQETSRLLTAAGRLDYLNVSNSTYSDLGSMANHIPSMYLPPAAFSHLWAGIKEAVDVPVLGIGRINSPHLAEEVLAQGKADLIGMVRELIADPKLPNKARDGRADDIRPCIACLESCLGRRTKGKFITCIHHPETGREEEWAGMPRPSHIKTVAVIGGGPAGLEAARVAANRGHQVTLYERSDHLGGQIPAVAAAPKRDAFSGITVFSEAQVRKLGVDVRLGIEVTPQMVLELDADAVVLALGSEPVVPMEPLDSGPTLTTAQDVLMDEADVGDSVMVVDTQGLHPGCDVAEFLLDRGKRVQLVTYAPYAGANIEALTWRLLYQRLLTKGLETSPFTAVSRLGEGTVVVRCTITGEERVVEGIDTVVFADSRRANDGLLRALKGKVKNLYAVGDCLAPRGVEQAIYEANKAAKGI